MKRTSILLILLAFSVIVIGFISHSFAEEKPEVTIVFKELNSQYWEIVRAGAEKGFRDFDIDGKVIAPDEATDEKQIDMLESIVKENPDVLIVSPNNSTIIPSLEEFVDNDIPVLLLDTDVPWDKKKSYVGTDNVDLGKRAGALLGSQLQPGDNVAIIGGDIDSPVSGDRMRGAEVTLKAAGIDIATKITQLSNDPSQIQEVTESILQTHADVKGIVAVNDEMALSALKVIGEHGLTIPVTGADGIIDMVELIEDGMLSGTVAQNPYDMGYLSVEAALKVTNGEIVERNIDSGVDIIIPENAKEKLDFLKNLLR